MEKTKINSEKSKKIHIINSFENNKREIINDHFGKKIINLLYILVSNPDCLFYFEEETRCAIKREGKIYYIELNVGLEGLEVDG